VAHACYLGKAAGDVVDEAVGVDGEDAERAVTTTSNTAATVKHV
jgi:hypothetical protein